LSICASLDCRQGKERKTTMKFLMTYFPRPDAAPPNPEKMAAIATFSEKMMKAGVLVMTGGLVRPSSGLRLTCEKGKTRVVDGPYAETKELIDGFALVEVSSREEAVRVAGKFMAIAGDGDSEILRVYDPSERTPPH
jgi:hypothetical protein